MKKVTTLINTTLLQFHTLPNLLLIFWASALVLGLNPGLGHPAPTDHLGLNIDEQDQIFLKCTLET